MSELFHQLGIDWRLLLSQAANFLILLAVLRFFAYGPLVKLLKERRARIEEGLEKADEADKRLGQMNEMVKERMKDAEHDALLLMRATEEKAKAKEADMLDEAKKKEATLFAQAEKVIEAKAEEMRKNVEAEAAALVKQAIVRTVELKPEAVDEALVGQAIKSLKARA
ncbi:MAG: F0F1-type synthase subunit b, F-type H+-transporting ATPase subunit b [Candidatus Parcubacteria bacterium]|jgi:F-type H+-transporting ATPase subunit b